MRCDLVKENVRQAGRPSWSHQHDESEELNEYFFVISNDKKSNDESTEKMTAKADMQVMRSNLIIQQATRNEHEDLLWQLRHRTAICSGNGAIL